MQNSTILLLLGGLISLVSTITTILINNYLEEKKAKQQLKNYPTTIIYTKQIDIYENINKIITPIVEEILVDILFIYKDEPSYITKNNESIKSRINNQTSQINELMRLSYYFVPSNVNSHLSKYLTSCFNFEENLNYSNAEICMKEYMDLRNIIRKNIGIDELSQDLVTAFEIGRNKTRSKIKGKRANK